MSITKASLLLLHLLLISCLSPLPSIAATSATPVRDVQAVQIILAAVSQCGVSGTLAVNDFVAKGKTTYYWGEGPTLATTTLRSRGNNGFRMDAQLPSGEVQSWSARPKSAKSKVADKLSDIPLDNAAKLQLISLPILGLAEALANTSTEITYVRAVTKAGRLTHVIRVKRDVWPGRKIPDELRFAVTEFEIDSATNTVSAVGMDMRTINSTLRTIPVRYEYSNYQFVQGRLVPLHIREVLGGQKTWETDIGTITFNTGLTDSDFDL